jgi:hypothetical protein
VKGHQEDLTTYLDRWALLNIHMDKAVKKHMRVAQTISRHKVIHGEPWSAWIHKKKLSSCMTKQFYNHIHEPKGEQYWVTKPDVSTMFPWM